MRKLGFWWMIKTLATARTMRVFKVSLAFCFQIVQFFVGPDARMVKRLVCPKNALILAKVRLEG